jgi:hypothetical protein
VGLSFSILLPIWYSKPTAKHRCLCRFRHCEHGFYQKVIPLILQRYKFSLSKSSRKRISFSRRSLTHSTCDKQIDCYIRKTIGDTVDFPMKLEIQNPSRSQLTIGMAYAAIGLLGFLLAQLGERLLVFIPPCLFQRWTGLPCPTCGATRTGIALSHFHVVDALLENPLFFILFCALFLWGMNTLVGYVTGKNIKLVIPVHEKKLVQILLLSAIILNWMYLILRTVLGF